MPRPSRTQFPGALYHVTARGNRRANIFVDDYDRQLWQDMLGETVERFGFTVHGFCLTPNHFHLLVQTRLANLSEGMHYLNGKYAKKFNWRHKLTGHVIQDRFYALLIERESHLLEVARYIALNPLRAQLARDPAAWAWSHHRYCCGLAHSPHWLTTSWIVSQFGDKAAYAQFVVAGIGQPDPLRRQREHNNGTHSPSLSDIAAQHIGRDQAIVAAYRTNSFSLAEIADFFSISSKTVWRMLQKQRQGD
ncbi:transposase [Massilia endophytica]|uniref:transposase n=1 Tax=Massilia endophytica TaxID=2899220 RepID=UPI001E37BBA2|nr:transposase [Massilia endophytica]UGQ47140.1 transposase [Massilia endophytica]